MKKKLLGLCIVLAMTVMAAGCGASGEKEDAKTEAAVDEAEDGKSQAAAEEKTGANVSSVGYDPADYVSLGEYKGLSVTISGDYATDAAALTAYMQEKLADADYVRDDSQTEVQEDSVVNVDYTGYQDGAAFDGGAATDQTIDVAKNASVDGQGYIDGFTAGLPGHKVGETVSYEVTFPENYGSASLAGQTVTFEFVINYICKSSLSVEELTDEYVAKQFDVDTVEEFRAQCQTEMEEEKAAQRESDVRDAVMEQVVENATVDGYPADVVEARLQNHLDGYIASAGSKDSFEQYISAYYGVTYERFTEELRASIEEGMESEMTFALIAEEEGIEVDEAEFSSYVEDLMERNSLTSKEQLFESYGSDVADGEEYLRFIYRCNQAVEFCVENVASVTEE